MYDADKLHFITGIYHKMILKEHRNYRLQFFLKNNEDIFVCDPVIYPAWSKHNFINNIGIGDPVKIGIGEEDASLLNNGQSDFINLVFMSGSGLRKQQLVFIDAEKYNLYRKMSFIKFYIFWLLGLLVFLYLKFYWKGSNQTVVEE